MTTELEQFVMDGVNYYRLRMAMLFFPFHFLFLYPILLKEHNIFTLSLCSTHAFDSFLVIV